LLRISHAPKPCATARSSNAGKQFQPGFCACTSVGATQDYSLSNFSTTDLGGGVTLVFDSLTRFTLQELFLVGTLALFGDTVCLKPGVDFTLQDNVIPFPAATQNVTGTRRLRILKPVSSPARRSTPRISMSSGSIAYKNSSKFWI
jgi:hypothetical protein